MEVWNIGLTMLLGPLGSFSLKTVVTRLALWMLALRWIRSIFVIVGLLLAGLFTINVNIGSFCIRSPDVVPVLLNIGVVNVVVVLYWLWPLLAETLSVMYLVTEVAGLAFLLDNFKIGGASFVASFVFAWLARGWWTWIVGIEAVLGLFLFIALMVSTGLMRLWIDQVQARRGKNLKDFRLALRQERKHITDQIGDIKRKLQQRKDNGR